MNSLNQPWAISSKKRQRFGNTWADIDFEFNQLSEKYSVADCCNQPPKDMKTSRI